MLNRIIWPLFRYGVFAALLAVTGALPQDAHAAGVNYRGPFTGRVVDQDTNQPIEGAVVLVEWDIRHMMAGQTFFDAKEVLTDKEGHFSIPKNWSFNPWWNVVMDSNVIIFKTGYGHVSTSYSGRGSWEDLGKELRARTPEKRRGMGPEWYFDVRQEGDHPLFLLKKLETEEERQKNHPYTGAVPNEKMRLLMQEMERQAVINGRGEVLRRLDQLLLPGKDRVELARSWRLCDNGWEFWPIIERWALPGLEAGSTVSQSAT
jgi:hypothetical protein